MKLKHIIKSAGGALRARKSRSGLTILGIVIGITAIILVMAIGQGAEKLIIGQVRGIGSRTISIEPGRQPKGPSDFYEVFTDSLKDREVEAIKKPANVRGNNKVAPIVSLTTSVAYGNETMRTFIYGGSDLLMEILDVQPETGAMFTEDDIKRRADVAVIGLKVKEELFGFSDALGEKIKIKNRNFKVTGILPPVGQTMMMNIDEMIVVPYTTAQKYLLGVNHYQAILVQAETEEIVPATVRDIEATLRELHNINNPDKDDFHVMTMNDAVQMVGVVTSVLTLLLASVAAISLLVGGIGIMNIMLVSVTERTREIGLRKALGATDNDILKQFLAEAIILTMIGGVIGIMLGALLSAITAIILARFAVPGWTFVFPFSAAVLGILVAGIVGLVFGLYPAKQAASKSPIEALRYE